MARRWRHRQHQRSKPTYEGWKQMDLELYGVSAVCSKPTYEGWKPTTAILIGPPTLGSKPTYEGWKRVTRVLFAALRARF